MDDLRFDSLTRQLAGAGTRRGLLRGLTGMAALFGLARPKPLSAHHGTHGPGDPCRSDDQCLAADAPLICADNGFAYDGPFNCCTYEGSRCGFDEACCWDNVCVGGVCASVSRFAGPGEPCTDSSQCVAADTAVTCGYNARTDDYRCCADEGSRCRWDSGCCGWLRCSDAGFCTGQPPANCDTEGCACDPSIPYYCAPGLTCCAVQSGFICATWAECGMG